MSSITQITLTIDQIELSRLNVRTNQDDANAVASIEASILELGLTHPINLHPLAGSKKFGVFAGGRRYRAIRNLVARGDLPANWPVKVAIYEGRTDVQIIELSLGENILRRDLQEYEIAAALARLAIRGETVATIAAALGQTHNYVAQRMRLGQLAPPIFETLAQGLLDIEQAKAYAATADHRLQLAVYDRLRQLPEHERTAPRIRAALKVGDAQSARLLRFVGADAYRAAGGRFEADLFADDAEERGRIVDEGVLAELAEARFEQVRAATRAAVGHDIRFTPKPPQDSYGGTDQTLRATTKAREGGGVLVPDGDVVAWIKVSEAGEPEVTYWWESRKAKAAGATPKATAAPARSGRDAGTLTGARAISDPYTYAPAAKAAAKDEHGVSADALFAVRAVRREVLRALVVEDAQCGGEVGLAHAIWAQLRTLLTREQVGLRSPNSSDHEAGTTTAAFDLARARIEEQTAHSIWTAAVKDVSAETFITEPDHAAAFVDFLNAGPRRQALAGAVLAGLLLERSAATPGYDHPAHAALAQMTRGTPRTVRLLWSPTAEFLELLPKAQQLAIAEPLVDANSLAKWSKVTGEQLTMLLAQALNGAGSAVPGRNRAAAAEWVHPLLAFPTLDFSDPAQSAAAECIEEAA